MLGAAGPGVFGAANLAWSMPSMLGAAGPGAFGAANLAGPGTKVLDAAAAAAALRLENQPV